MQGGGGCKKTLGSSGRSPRPASAITHLSPRIDPNWSRRGPDCIRLRLQRLSSQHPPWSRGLQHRRAPAGCDQRRYGVPERSDTRCLGVEGGGAGGSGGERVGPCPWAA